MPGISLVSINVEKSEHIDRVTKFLTERMPDVICFQELCENDIAHFQEVLAAEVIFTPGTKETIRRGGAYVQGPAIMSRLPVRASRSQYYVKIGETLPESDQTKPETYTNVDRALLSIDVEKDDTEFHICNTHFTWSPKGQATDLQRLHMADLITLLEQEGEFVLVGDFNAPRGGDIFAMLASHYKDNIPQQYATSIDATLHRAGKERPQELADKMVDGVFTTPSYTANAVELHAGVSDHFAITTTITRAL